MPRTVRPSGGLSETQARLMLLPEPADMYTLWVRTDYSDDAGLTPPALVLRQIRTGSSAA